MHKQMRLNLEHVGACDLRMIIKYYFNILKTEAAQTIESVLGEFGACGGGGGLVTSLPIIQCLIS